MNTFDILRSSYGTYAKQQLGCKTYNRVATFMCHDANTAKRFYQVEDTLQSRALTTMAISTYAAKKRKKKEECKKASGGDDKIETISSGEEEQEDREPM